jgi:cobalt-zinc-cadmium efflux system membrane fusion protein
MSAATILLVDDDEVLSQVLRRVLTREGYTVVEAGNVAEALHVARTNHPQLALLDLCLPDGDGMELARQLAEQVGPMPMILMTAYPVRLREHPELAQDFRHVLTKPLNLEELRQAIASALDGQPAAAAPQVGPAPAALEAPPPIPPPAPLPPEHAAAPSPAPGPAAPAEPAAPRGGVRWALVGGAAAAAALALFFGLPALGMPSLTQFFRPHTPSTAPAAPKDDLGAKLVEGMPDTLELPEATVKRLGISTAVLSDKTAPRPLELSGSLAFDPNYLARVQSRFPGEVVELGQLEEPGITPSGRTEGPRALQYGDRVQAGQLMAVVWCKDLGEKKSELVDAIAQLRLDEETLQKLEELYREGNTSEAVIRQARRNVAGDRTAVNRAERTLRVWQLPEKEIQEVKDEAERVIARQGAHDQAKERDWARVEVRASFSGAIVEKNVVKGSIIDTTFVLYQIADLKKLAVYVHAYEEDLRALEKLRAELLPRLIPWQVRIMAESGDVLLESDGVERIGYVVDPNQHTDLVIGRVDNRDGKLRAGQFAIATVLLPAPPGVVSVPAAAVVEDGARSIVFVQPGPSRPVYTLRRVAVAQRLGDFVYVRSRLTDAQRKQGLQELEPGERVVTGAPVELQAALEELQNKAKAERKQ